MPPAAATETVGDDFPGWSPPRKPEPAARRSRTGQAVVRPDLRGPSRAAAGETRRSSASGTPRPPATGRRIPTAPPLPSQAGIEPRDREDIETTESRYQDGSLASDPAAKPPAEPNAATPTPPAPMPIPPSPTRRRPAEKPETPGTDDAKSAPPPRETLLEGPNPVDVPVPRETPPRTTKSSPLRRKTPKDGRARADSPADAAETRRDRQARERSRASSGYQRKTAIVGSISRTGRSALDVEDSPLGRYQAAISRAVEQEWQRNCVRHRDFITPGFLTVRFFVETSGKVRSVQFVGDMETGEVQKGFTLNSIRDADIPADARRPAQGIRQGTARTHLQLLLLTIIMTRHPQPHPRRHPHPTPSTPSGISCTKAASS